MSKKSVLIIEDNADARLLLARAVKMEGHPVIEAANGAEAFEKLSADVGLILMDLSMPLMSGEEFIARLRESESYAHVKVVVVSGWDDLARRAQAVGANGYLRKPVDLNELVKTVNASTQP